MTNRSNKSSPSSPGKGSQVSPQSIEDRKGQAASQGEICPSDSTSIASDDEEEE